MRHSLHTWVAASGACLVEQTVAAIASFGGVASEGLAVACSSASLQDVMPAASVIKPWAGLSLVRQIDLKANLGLGFCFTTKKQVHLTISNQRRQWEYTSI